MVALQTIIIFHPAFHPVYKPSGPSRFRYTTPRPSSPSARKSLLYIRISTPASCLICSSRSTLLLDLLSHLISHPPSYIRDPYPPHPVSPPPPPHPLMSANVLLANRSSLSNRTSPPSPYSHSEWQHYSPPDTWVRPDLPLSHLMSPHPFSHHQASGSGSSTQMHNGFSQNQASIRTLFAPVPLADVRACTQRLSVQALPL